MSSRRTVLLLVFLTCCHVLGILIFCKGFLLKRVLIPEYSTCTPTDRPTPLPTCTDHVRRYRRVVWLLVDALRYDFMLWDDSLETPPVYRNKMAFVRDLLRDHPSNAKLFKFIADPPTSTMQRLKALTTGGLPTFIDIGSNFNSYAILEDSLIRQVSKNHRNVTFMGDDTWLGLYPNMLSKVFPFPSLNVKDIHTVDDGVLSQLFSELEQKDADLLIGHFLGVDHIGHTYSPSHWTMGEKLPQMDRMIRDVVEVVDDETIVLVFGDHGMTSSGDHGGETELETHAALLVYSKQPLFHPHQPSGRAVYQIDLVPTVAFLLGLPIPFSNLGMVIPELFLSPHGSLSGDGYSNRVTLDLLNVLRINARQIHNYLTTYAQYSGDFPQQTFVDLAEKLEAVKALHDASTPGASQTELTRVADEYVRYMRDVNEMCHQVWAKFDDVLIYSGLSMVVLSVAAAPLIVASSQWLSRISVCAVISLPVSIALSTTTEDLFVSVVFWTLFLVLLSLLWTGRSSLLKLPLSLEPLSVLALLLAILHAISLLSNSFILYEGDMIVFFLQTLIFCLALRHLRLVAAEGKGQLVYTLLPYFALSVCLRANKLFYSCRDMQYQDGCQESAFTQPYIVAVDVLGPLVSFRLLSSCVVVVATPIFVSRVIGRSSGYKCVDGRVVDVVKYGLPVAGVCVGGYWCLQLLPLAELSYWHHVILPWVVYAVCGVTLVMVVWKPVTKIVRGVESDAVTALVSVVMVISLWVPLEMILNDGLALAGVLVLLQAILSLSVFSHAGSPLLVAVFWSLLSSHSFFATGHTATVTSLRFECAFTGIHGEINKFNLPLAGLLVGLHTLGTQILFGLAFPLLLLVLKKHLSSVDKTLRLALSLIAIHSLKLVVTLFAASLHRRHLMIWQVFTPRVLYEGAFQLTWDLSLIISILVASRVKRLLQF